jgi:hypothetical protein
MPVDPVREAQVRDQTEREFAEIESAAVNASPGTLDVLRVYGGLDIAVRQADAYLSLLNPISAHFSTTSSSNIES